MNYYDQLFNALNRRAQYVNTGVYGTPASFNPMATSGQGSYGQTDLSSVLNNFLGQQSSQQQQLPAAPTFNISTPAVNFPSNLMGGGGGAASSSAAPPATPPAAPPAGPPNTYGMFNPTQSELAAAQARAGVTQPGGGGGGGPYAGAGGGQQPSYNVFGGAAGSQTYGGQAYNGMGVPQSAGLGYGPGQIPMGGSFAQPVGQFGGIGTQNLGAMY